ncbi:MAG: hypothetical protein ACR2NG_01885 [Acidimicrobiia bacterium]
MSRNTSNQSGGNDGSWFLEAIGQTKAPTASEVVADLEAENTIVDDPEISIHLDQHANTEERAAALVAANSFDGNPGTSTSSFDPVPTPPPPPPEVTAEHEPLGDLLVDAPPLDDDDTFDDTDLSPALRSKRNFRWPVVVGLLVAIALVVAAAIVLPARVEDQALEVRQTYYDSAFDVRDYLPSAQVALDSITNPSSDDSQVASAVPMIAELDTRAFALETATSEPLPSTLPLVPSGPIDELEPLKDTGAILGAASSDLSRRLGNAYVYRTSIPLLLNTGSLPIAATTNEINDISVTLASSLATDAGIVADLPDDPAFAEVKTTASATLVRAAEWQDEYLDALTSEDADAAAALVGEMTEMRITLQSLTADALVAFRAEADITIVSLAGDLDVYLVAVSNP